MAFPATSCAIIIADAAATRAAAGSLGVVALAIVRPSPARRVARRGPAPRSDLRTSVRGGRQADPHERERHVDPDEVSRAHGGARADPDEGRRRSESPARMTKVSMTCFALYLASGDVTSHKACRVVFDSE